MKIPRMEDEIQARRYFVLQLKCPSFLTDHDQTYMCLGHWRRKPDGEFQGNPSNGRRDTEKEICSSSKLPLITDRSQPILDS